MLVVKPLPHEAIRRQLALLPLYIVGTALTWQLVVLLSVPGPRDAAGIVKGHDFAHFYTLGTVARSGHLLELYDHRALTDLMWRVVPETRPDTFQPLYGPQVALAFAPFAALPYERAVVAWLVTSLLLYLAAAAMIVHLARDLRRDRFVLWLLLVLSPALNVLLVSGQNSSLALLAICAAWGALDRGRTVLAGLALGVLAFKPQLLAGALAILLLAREWRIVIGAILSAAAQLGAAWAWSGSEVMAAYVGALAGPLRRAGIAVSLPQHLHSLAGFWRLLLNPGPLATALYVACALGLIWLAARSWRRDPRRSGFAILVLAMVLVAPHLYVYDLVLLAPALAIGWAEARRREGVSSFRQLALTWMSWLAPLAGPIALATRIQVSTLVLGLLTILMAAGTGSDTAAERPPRQAP